MTVGEVAAVIAAGSGLLTAITTLIKALGGRHRKERDDAAERKS